MAKLSYKQKLIKEFPTFKEDILSWWDYYTKPDKETGSLKNWEIDSDLPRTQKNLYGLIYGIIEHKEIIEKENIKNNDIVPDLWKGLIEPDEWIALQKLDN